MPKSDIYVQQYMNYIRAFKRCSKLKSSPEHTAIIHSLLSEMQERNHDKYTDIMMISNDLKKVMERYGQ